jgi:hypothetical protein
MWILVEGKDDKRLANAILRPIVERQYDYVDIWEYAQETPKKTADFLRSINCMRADYLFFGDINASPCVTAKKEAIRTKYHCMVQSPNTVVVVKEIESWYAAGMDDQACQELGIASLSCTDHLTKEQFRELMPKRFKGFVVDFMVEILKRFSLETARQKNRSFCYLMDFLEKSREA